MKRKSFNLKNLILPPLLVTFVFTFLIGMLVYSFTLTAYRNNQEKDRTHLTQVFADHIADSVSAKERYEADMIRKMIEVGEHIIGRKSEISNAFLSGYANQFDIHILFWYDDEGTIVNDASETYVGYQISSGEQEYAFLISGKTVHTDEVVRHFAGEEQLYKFVYIRDSSGYFLQIGFEAEAYFSASRPQSFQQLLSDFVTEEPQVHYALVVDRNYQAIADTDIHDIGVIYYEDPYYQRSFEGEMTTFEWKNSTVGYTAVEISAPVYFNQSIEYVLAIGFSLDYYYQARTLLLLSFLALALSVIGTYLITVYYRLLRPLHLLGSAIDDFDQEKMHIPTISKDRLGLFVTIYEAIQGLTNRISTENYRSQKLKEQVNQMAYLDYLTKIPNRRSFVEQINPTINKYNTFAILFLDLDGFKTYNDVNGHIFGDRLLISVANRLKERIKTPAYISRYGGDEFLIFFPYENVQELKQFVSLLRGIFDQPFEVEQMRYPIDVSIGISLYPRDGQLLDDLIRKADIAMYEAKKTGKNFTVYFEASMSEKLDIENNVLKALQKALANDGISLVFQPQVEIATGKIVSLESLARLSNTHIPASIVFDVAEKAGLIKELGRAVIRKSIQQLATWKKMGMKPVTTFVNISSYQLEDADLTEYIKNQLSSYDIDPHLLGFEVTENATLKRESLAQKFFMEMNELGVRTALDDFGTGHAGLTYLAKYPVSLVKLDRTFAASLLNETDLPIFETIIHLAQLLKFDTLAHGIETKDQLELLKKTSCHLVQGFILYRPMSAQQIFDLFVQGKMN